MMTMRDLTTEVRKSDYLHYKSNPAAYNREREENLPIVLKCGCGWYGCEVVESNGHYYQIDKVGESCD